ncbi:Protein of unknown function [Pyronema omphalodes CBS 100304]|uniref:Uncharacterized protein n=1 Tax=Pyronema omphalodes (strain CBS 100304) TaxID=1076935 RepID=U4L673_PYROM|nr:Protein of unknown function [Pyronema omphalodes CBS 100304]
MNGFQCPIKRDAETLIYNAQRCKIAFEPAEAYEQACRRRMAVVLYSRMTYRDVDTAIYGTLTWVQAVHRAYTKDGKLMLQGMCPPSLATSLPLFTRSKLGLKKAAWDEFWIMNCVRAKERAQALEASDSGVWTLADIQEVFNSIFDES